MIDQFVFKDVWKADDAKSEADAIAAWQAAGDKLGILTDEERAKLLCIVAYDGSQVCATLTCQIRYFPLIRENMAFIQIFVTPDYRQRGIVIPLTLASHSTMTRYALENPSLKLGGTAGRTTIRGTLDRPVGGALMVVIGYTEKNEPIWVRWFDHFRIDEEAARARDPRIQQQQAN